MRLWALFVGLLQAATAAPNLLFLAAQPGPGNISAPNRTVSLTLSTNSISPGLSASDFTVRLIDAPTDTTVVPFSISYDVGVSTLRFAVPANFVFQATRTFAISLRQQSGAYSNALPVVILPSGFTVSPNTARQGQRNLTVVVTGTNTRIGQGLGTTAFFGAGVSVNGSAAGTPGRINDANISSQTSATVNLDVDFTAPTSVRDVTLSGPDSLTLANGFTILPPLPLLINSATPSAGYPGLPMTLDITGLTGNFANNSFTIYFTPTAGGPSVSIASTGVAGNKITFPVPPALAVTNPTPYTFQLQGNNAAGLPFRATTTPAFLVTPFPSVDLSPSGLRPGTTLPVTINGTYTNFSAGVTTVSFGAGITAGPVVVTSPTSLQTTLTVALGAAQSLGNFQVQTGAESVTGSYSILVPGVVIVSPSLAQTGTVVNVSISGTNTGFVQGLTTVGFGPNITTNSVTVSSPFALVANITIAQNAAPGARSATVTTLSQIDTSPGGLTVVTAALGSVVPSITSQGTTQNITITGINTSFLQGSTAVTLGQGILVNSVNVGSSGALVANITISQNAALGPRDVTVSTGSQVVTGAGLFNVTASAAITSVAPSVVTQGQTRAVTITGVNTSFSQGGSVVSFGPGVTVSSLQVTSLNTLVATIEVNPNAPIGARDVTVTTGSQVAIGPGLFNVAPSASISSVTPGLVTQGKTHNLTIIGQNTSFASGLSTLTAGAGITVNSVTVTGPNSLIANVTVTAGASLGSRSLSITTGTEVATGSSLLTVLAGPAIVSTSPAAGQQGRTLNVTVTGQNTNFIQGITTLDLGSGISVNAITVNGAGSLSANITISANANLGQRDVTVISGAETAIGVAQFSVVPGAPASVSSVSPISGAQGRTLSVAITGADTHFVQGSTLVSFGVGISVSSVNVGSGTALIANVIIDPNATLGQRDVVVTTSSEVASSLGAFTVTSRPAASITSVSPNSGRQGQTLTVILTGQATNFVQGITAVTFGAGVNLNSVTVQNLTSLAVNVTIAPNATLGLRDVAVTTIAETAAAAGAFTINSAGPAISSVTPASGDRGQTLTIAITGSNTSFSQGVSVVAFGPGVSVGSTAVTSPTTLTANINVSSTAVLGQRDVSVSTGFESATSTGGFTVTTPASLLSFTPPTASPGATFTATLTAQGTNFAQGGVTVDLGPGVTIGQITVVSPTVLLVPVSVNGGATLGGRTVNVASAGASFTLPLGFTVVPGGGPLSCAVTSGVPPLLRAEGITELVGDIVLVCTGGTAGQLQTFNLQLFLNTQITSRVLSGNTTDALLIVDEALTGGSVYSGEIGAANNSVVFTGVAFAAPGGGQRTIRITNIRANAAGLGASISLIPTQVVAMLSVSSSQALPLDAPQLTVGYIQPGLRFDTRNCGGLDARSSTLLDQCLGQNDSGARSDLIGGATGAMQFSLRFTEGFQTAFRPMLASRQTGPGAAGVSYSSESGLLYNGGGVANFGTRLSAKFTNVPRGMRLFVTSTPSFGSSSTVAANLVNGSTPERVVLTCGLVGSAGIPGAEIPVVDGVATATWEITSSDPASLETVTFGVAVAYSPDLANDLPGVGAISVTGNFNPSFVPASGVGQSLAADPVPRFLNAGISATAFSVNRCVTNILFPFVTNQAGFDTGISIANTSRAPLTGASRQQSGTCTVSYYGATNGGAAPVSQTTSEVVAAGASLTFVLSSGGNLGLQGTPGFQGYLLAQCNFQHAHGFAFITDGPIGASRVAEGYLGLILESGIGTRTGVGEALGH